MIQAANRYSFGLQVINLGDESTNLFSLITSLLLIVSIVFEILQFNKILKKAREVDWNVFGNDAILVP